MAIPTPSDLAKAARKAPKTSLEFDKGRRLGRQEGEDAVRHSVLTFLQEKYLADDAPERGSDEAKAILQLAGEVAQHLKRELKR